MQCCQPICKLDATEVFNAQVVLCAVRILQEGKQLYCNNKNSKYSIYRHCSGSFNFVVSGSAYFRIIKEHVKPPFPWLLDSFMFIYIIFFFLKEAGGPIETLEQ